MVTQVIKVLKIEKALWKWQKENDQSSRTVAQERAAFIYAILTQYKLYTADNVHLQYYPCKRRRVMLPLIMKMLVWWDTNMSQECHSSFVKWNNYSPVPDNHTSGWVHRAHYFTNYLFMDLEATMGTYELRSYGGEQ